MISFCAVGAISSAGEIYGKEYWFVEIVPETSVFVCVNWAVKSWATFSVEVVNWFKSIFSVNGVVVCSLNDQQSERMIFEEKFDYFLLSKAKDKGGNLVDCGYCYVKK